MKKTALLIDGGWFTKILRKELVESCGNGGRKPTVTADVLIKNALQVVAKDEEVWRILYYDAYPYDGNVTNPVDGKTTDFGSSPTNVYASKLFKELGQMDMVMLRLGILKPRGWALSDTYVHELLDAAHQATAIPTLTTDDVIFSLEQKGVDIRLGLDVATLALKKQVDRLLFFSGDSDILPALKLARLEGLQVAIVQVGNTKLNYELEENADFVRVINPEL